MLMKLRRLMRGGEKGQGMTEYIIIVCLVAIACLMAVGVFGDRLIQLFNAATNSLGGQGTATSLSPIPMEGGNPGTGDGTTPP